MPLILDYFHPSKWGVVIGLKAYKEKTPFERNPLKCIDTKAWSSVKLKSGHSPKIHKTRATPI